MNLLGGRACRWTKGACRLSEGQWIDCSITCALPCIHRSIESMAAWIDWWQGGMKRGPVRAKGGSSDLLVRGRRIDRAARRPPINQSIALNSLETPQYTQASWMRAGAAGARAASTAATAPTRTSIIIGAAAAALQLLLLLVAVSKPVVVEAFALPHSRSKATRCVDPCRNAIRGNIPTTLTACPPDWTVVGVVGCFLSSSLSLVVG